MAELSNAARRYHIFRRECNSYLTSTSVDGHLVRTIHLLEDYMECPEFTLVDIDQRAFFWRVVETEFKRLDAIYSKTDDSIASIRSKKFYHFLKKLEALDDPFFNITLSKYPSVCNGYSDEEFMWLKYIR